MAEQGAERAMGRGADAVDGKAFRQTVLPHLDAAYRLAVWLVRDPVAAEDITQDAMVKALTYFSSFRGGDGRAWTLGIVRRAAYDHLGRRSRRAEISLDDEPDEGTALVDPGADPERALHQAQERRGLEDALAALPVDLRACLVLKEFEELSYRQIAEVTGVPIGTVMSRLWRARRLLAREVADVR